MSEEKTQGNSSQLERLDKKERFYKTFRAICICVFAFAIFGGAIYDFFRPLQKETLKISEIEKNILAFEIVKEKIQSSELPSVFYHLLNEYYYELAEIKTTEHYKLYSKINNFIIYFVFFSVVFTLIGIVITIYPLDKIRDEKAMLQI